MDITETALERAIRLADGMTALVRKLNERGKEIKGHATIYQWKQSRVPSDYCPDIEALTGVKCEELRPDVNWSVLRGPVIEERRLGLPDIGQRIRKDDTAAKAD